MKYRRGTTLGQGGLAVFELTGSDADFLAIEATIAFSGSHSDPMGTGALRIGRFQNTAGETIDEILYAAPASHLRLLTGHGGSATSVAIRTRLEQLGAKRDDAGDSFCSFPARNQIERDADTRLPECRTERQAALLLCARNSLANRIQEILAQPEREQVAQELHTLADDSAFARNLLKPRRLCLIGPPNAGKSSLFNILLAEDRALVSDEAGTTRDAVEEWIDIGGYHVCLSDTAGVRTTADAIETEALQKTRSAFASADVVALVLDSSRPLSDNDQTILQDIQTAVAKQETPPAVFAVLNKSDQPAALDTEWVASVFPEINIVETSCVEGKAVTDFEPLAVEALGGAWDGTALPFTEEQAAALRTAATAVANGEDATTVLRSFLDEPPLC